MRETWKIPSRTTRSTTRRRTKTKRKMRTRKNDTGFARPSSRRCMIIETFEAGPIATNGYLVADKEGGKALVIDAPQGVASSMVEQARKWNTPIGILVNTHGH